jgi:hypothetical protein
MGRKGQTSWAGRVRPHGQEGSDLMGRGRDRPRPLFFAFSAQLIEAKRHISPYISIMSRKLRGSTNKGKTCHVVTKVNRDHRELDPKEDKERLS